MNQITNETKEPRYLNKEGLISVISKLVAYVNRLNGDIIPAYNEPEDGRFPSVAEELRTIWATIGGNGNTESSLTEIVGQILSKYVKSISHSEEQEDIPLNVIVTEGKDGNNEPNGEFTIKLVDNGLADIIETLTNERVSSLDVDANNSSVGLSVNTNTGQVTITIDSTVIDGVIEELSDDVAALKTGKISTVEEGDSGEYVAPIVEIDSNTQTVTISINDEELVTELNNIKNSKLPNPHKLTIDWEGNTESSPISYDGSSEVNIEIDRVTQAATADDADKLGGQEPSYYATADNLDGLGERVTEIENNYTKTVEITSGEYVTVSPEGSQKGDVTFTINDEAIGEAIGELDDRIVEIEDSYVKTIASDSNDGDVILTVVPETGKGEVKISANATKLRDDITNLSDAIDDLDDQSKRHDEEIARLNNYVESVTVEIEDDDKTYLDFTVIPDTSTDQIIDGETIPGDNGKQTHLIIDTTKLKEKFGNVDEELARLDKYVEDVNVVDNASYINLSIVDDINAAAHGKQSQITIDDTALSNKITEILQIIAGLGQVVEIKGVVNTLPETTEGYGNGDVVIVGNEEYICYEGQWYLFGHTSELVTKYNAHKHTYTPAGTIGSTFAGKEVDITVGTPSKTTTIKSVKGVGSLPTHESKTVAKSDHTHSANYTPEGSVGSTFVGTTATLTTGNESGNTTVKSVKDVGTSPTRESVEVAPNHSHKVTAVGTITNEVSMTSSDDEETVMTPTITYENATLIIDFSLVTVNKAHTHTVDSTFAGSEVNTNDSGTVEVWSITDVGSVPTTEDITVAANNHTHSVDYTPEGTVNSTFTGTNATITTGVPSATESVNSITSNGSLPTTEDIIVASSDHTHTTKHTPEGTVNSIFTGTQGTTNGPDQTTPVPDEIITPDLPEEE